jgi:hypothetical protein
LISRSPTAHHLRKGPRVKDLRAQPRYPYP